MQRKVYILLPSNLFLNAWICEVKDEWQQQSQRRYTRRFCDREQTCSIQILAIYYISTVYFRAPYKSLAVFTVPAAALQNSNKKLMSRNDA